MVVALLALTLALEASHVLSLVPSALPGSVSLFLPSASCNPCANPTKGPSRVPRAPALGGTGDKGLSRELEHREGAHTQLMPQVGHQRSVGQ